MQIDGTPGDDTLNGTGENDTINGLAGNDTINPGAGADSVNGGDGDDLINFGANFGTGDSVDGGLGNDQLTLQGDYTGANEITNPNLTGVEAISVLAGFDYRLFVSNANMPASGIMSVFSVNLQPGDTLRFNGGATNGSYHFYGGLGSENVNGNSRDDVFYFGPGQFNMGSQAYAPGSDFVSGADGNDRLVLDGNYTLLLSGAHIYALETIELARGPGWALNNFKLTTDAGLVSGGRTLTIAGTQLGTSLHFDGSGEQASPYGGTGHFKVYGGEVGDRLIGGAGDDWFHGGGGADTMVGAFGGDDTYTYTEVSQSTLATTDTVDGLNAGDKIDLSAIDAIAGTPANDDFVWSVDANFHSVAGELRYRSASATAGFLEGDTDGDGAADLSIGINLLNEHVFGQGDVILTAPPPPAPPPPKTEFELPENWNADLLDYWTTYVGDFNGDGRDDLYNLSNTDAYFSNGETFHSGDIFARNLPINHRFHIGDFNGDGLDDALRYVEGVGSEMYVSTPSDPIFKPSGDFALDGLWTDAWSGEAGWYVGDFDGDGKDDVCRYLRGAWGAGRWLAGGDNFVSDGSWTTGGFGSRACTVGDFNGDGMDDVFRTLPGESGADMWLSTGSGFARAGSWTDADPGAENWYVGDFNGDGMDDVFRYLEGQSGADMFLSTGSAFVHDGSWTGAGHGAGLWSIGDFDGDGSSDLMRLAAPLPGQELVPAEVLI
jgi:hypothetical protein